MERRFSKSKKHETNPLLTLLKLISGDDDLPKRDDIGERRRKHEMRVLAGAGVEPSDDGEMDSDLEFYGEVGRQRSAKISAKENMYSRSPAMPVMQESLVDGKRQISYQMDKNRGLTPNRKKTIKNPRVKYRGKHKNAQKCWKGQVQGMKKPSGPYGGETTGINTRISRSIRFKG